MAYGSFNAGPGKAPDEDVVRTDQIGVPGGVATLDADGKLSESPLMPTTLRTLHMVTSAPAWQRCAAVSMQSS